MVRGIRYTDEFKRDAVFQVTDRGHSVGDVSIRLGICTKSLYDWIKKFGKPSIELTKRADFAAENRRLKAELTRVTEERDILKKATAYFAREAK